MGGKRAHRESGEARRIRLVTLAVIAPLIVATAVAMVLLWPAEDAVPDDAVRADQYAGVVLKVNEEPCPGPPAGMEGLENTEFAQDPAVQRCGTVRVELDEGPDAGTKVTVQMPTGAGAPEVADGDEVTLIPTDTPDGVVYSIVDHQRSTQLWVLMAAFALAVIAFGRWRGVTALLGLAVTFVVLLFFVVPAILAGESPLLVATVGAAAIVLTVLYLTHGFSLTTTVALAGTLASLALTGLLAHLSVGGLQLTGITDDQSAFLGSTFSVDMRGLLLAGILIGSLGVLDDVTMSQSATVAEVARANPGYGFARLYRAGDRVGRAHVASVINTIILAYAGSSLPLMILIVAYNDSLGGVLTDQIIAQEIVRSVVATVGLVAAVPITTALAAWAAPHLRRSPIEPEHEGHSHG